MIELEPAIVITTMVTLVSLSAWVGSLAQKVKGNRKDIDKNEQASIMAFNTLKKENNDSHDKIEKENNDSHEKLFDKCDEIGNELGEVKGIVTSIKKNGGG